MKALYRSVQALTGVPGTRVKKAVPKGRKKKTGETSRAGPDAAMRVEPVRQEEAAEAVSEPQRRERVERVYVLEDDQEEEEETLQDRRRKRKEKDSGQSSEGAPKRAKNKGKALAISPQGTDAGEEMTEEGEEEPVLKILPGNWMVMEGDTLSTPGVATQLADFIDLEGDAQEDVDGDAFEQTELMLRGQMKEMLRSLAIMRQWRQHMLITDKENERLRLVAANWEAEKAGLVAEIATAKSQAERERATAEAAEREKRDMEEAITRLRAERDRAKERELDTMALLKQTREQSRERSARWAVLLGVRENHVRRVVAEDAVRWYKGSPAFKEDAEAYLARGTFLFMKQVAQEVKEAVPDCDVRQIPALGPYFAVEEAMKNAPQPEDTDSVEEWSSAEEEGEEEVAGETGKAAELPLGSAAKEVVEEERAEATVPPVTEMGARDVGERAEIHEPSPRTVDVAGEKADEDPEGGEGTERPTGI